MINFDQKQNSGDKNADGEAQNEHGGGDQNQECVDTIE